MKSSLNFFFSCLKTVFPASTKTQRVDKYGEEVLSHCKKHSNDSVELAGVRKLFFTIWVAMFAICLAIEI